MLLSSSLVSYPALPVFPSAFVTDDVLKYCVFASYCRQRQLTIVLLQELLQLQICIHTRCVHTNSNYYSPLLLR